MKNNISLKQSVSLIRDTVDFGRALFVSNDPKKALVEEWISKHESLLTGLCKKWLRSLKVYGYEWDDLYQESCLAILQAWDSYDSDRCGILPESYFSKVIENRFSGIIRKSRSNKRKSAFNGISLTELEPMLYTEEELGNSDRITDQNCGYYKYAENFKDKADVEAEVFASLSVEEIKASIAKLPEKVRSVAELRAMELNQKEIAAIIGLSQPYVSGKLKSAKNQLKDIINKK